ncbi:MAG TPA: pre-peptidase C-terminal domain-containing protein [Gemmatimonadales bacterium]|jgi:hypothetical protein|nr:pre-peptidase C-terminal domain-containing protein [Gemmatimonadales bacterium]
MDGLWRRWVVVCVAAIPSVLAAQGGGTAPIVHRGALASGDGQLQTGEFYDSYEFQGRAGQRVAFDLTSSAFDPYLMVIAPSGDKKENDDFNGSSSRSRLELALEETGTYRVVVTSYKKDEAGAYELRIETGAAAGAGSPAPGVRVESGRLAAGDTTLRTGEYRDSYTFAGRRGQTATVDLRSTAFDPYLIVIDPSGKQHENDDYAGDANRSLVSYELPEDGTYRVWVTSYKSGETGQYDVRIQSGTAGAAAVAATPRVERGRLAAGDDTLRSGEYVDSYTLEGRPGQHVTLDVASNDFDTYLMLVPPRGERLWNDDVEGKPHHSVIEADLNEAGQYRVAVTSYERGETGAYELRIDYGAPAAASPATGRTRDVEAIAYGDTKTGALSSADARLSSGEYRDLYAFDGATGDSIVVELASGEFDPYLSLIPPGEGQEQIDNDDADGRQDLSRVTVRLRASGRYRIMATSYAAAKTGAYRLSLRRAATGGGPAVVARPPAATGGRVYGVFVGISNYGGRANNLMFTADDARRMYDAMLRGAGMRAADGVVLVDQQATLAAVRQAIERVGREAGPNDMFVLFYSGHGGRNPRAGGQAADPDNLDETLVFYDDDLSDDDLSQLLAGIRARVSLLVFDACFSGGFSKDVISVPGRMGLFSSEEDVTSGVAVKFRAGGYLAEFIAEAVGDRLADADGDHEITALELSQYLHERYRADVKSGGPGDYVRTGGPQTGYQHLVVDRGSIGPYDVLFR